jgi:transmembrane sensor
MSSEFNSMEDLVFSRSFRDWVLNGDSAEKGFWESWVLRHPEKAEVVKYAKAAIYALHLDRSLLSEDDIEEEVRKALVRLKEAPRYLPVEGQEGRKRGFSRGMRTSRFWLLAAAMSGIVCVAGVLFYRARVHPEALQSFLSSHKKKPVRQQVTDAADDQTLNLPDGSIVQLSKNSKLYYSADWGPASDRREVFLEGTAFFDIRKNPAVPFYVYTGQAVTRVLGTRFMVRSVAGEARTTVTVVAGTVSVYRQEDFDAQTAGMVLTANQAAICEWGDGRLRKTLADRPEPLQEAPDTFFIFHETPIKRVFGRLQELYGIPIQFDEEAVDSCSLTATMGKETFYEKLNKICQAIRGSYEKIDGNIVVTTPGCRQK